jgi:hypothetical protein
MGEFVNPSGTLGCFFPRLNPGEIKIPGVYDILSCHEKSVNKENLAIWLNPLNYETCKTLW